MYIIYIIFYIIFLYYFLLETCFQIIHPSVTKKGGVITLKASSLSEKARWIDALKRVLNEYKNSDKERKVRSRDPSKNLQSIILYFIQIYYNKIQLNYLIIIIIDYLIINIFIFILILF